MPRANRYFVPGHIYHLIHRCHNRQFLLRFARDRDSYRQKLREAISQHELALLDYCLTGNHPREWAWCGYHELAGLRKRFRILDLERLKLLLGNVDINTFRGHYEVIIQETISKDQAKRELNGRSPLLWDRRHLLSKSRNKSKAVKPWKYNQKVMPGY